MACADVMAVWCNAWEAIISSVMCTMHVGLFVMEDSALNNECVSEEVRGVLGGGFEKLFFDSKT